MSSDSNQVTSNSQSNTCQVCGKAFASKKCLKTHEKIHLAPRQLPCDFEGCHCSFRSPKLLRKHKKTHSDTPEYRIKCDLCHLTFTQKEHLVRHVVNKHVADKEFQCHVCLRKFITEKVLRSHLENRHGSGKAPGYCCDLCPMGYFRLDELMRHLEDTHSRHQRCDLCKASFVNREELEVHSTVVEKVSESNTFSCSECSTAFTSVCLLSQHSLSTHPEKKRKVEVANKSGSPSFQEEYGEFKCEFCEASYDRKSYLVAHQKCVHPNAEWVCKVCSKVFNRRSLLSRHEQERHGDLIFKCHICSNAYKSKYTLGKHLKSHVDPESFKCNICSKTYACKQVFARHIKRHSEGRKFKCDKCPQVFLLRGGLRNHISKFHGNAARSHLYECPLCPATFQNRNYLEKEHIPSHSDTGDRPFACTTCSRRFKTTAALALHKNKEKEFSFSVDKSGQEEFEEEEYDCQRCGLSFERNSDLLSHEKSVHPDVEETVVTGPAGKDKRFKCPLCPATFTKRSYLERTHIPSHSGSSDWPFACEACSRRFKTKNALGHHSCPQEETQS